MTPRATRILRPTPANLNRLARVLQRGGIVGVPTETVYGLAANALSAPACRKIFQAKGRPATDPLIVHVAHRRQLAELCDVNPAAERLMRAFWPGPLTLVLPKHATVPDVVTSGRPSVAVRMPAHRVFRTLLRRTGLPLAAPSANPFGYVSPTTAAHVVDGLNGKVGFVLDGGASRIGLESTIVDVRDPAHPVLLRPGAITAAMLSRVLGVKVKRPAAQAAASASRKGQLAPGMLLQHYSPHTPVTLYERIDFTPAPGEAALLLRARPRGRSHSRIFCLSPSGNLAQMAKRLFAQLRTLDHGGYRHIHVELARGHGIAEAINDRLRRAAAKRK
jgi:L-threonylcarbamoyladenylate synthase